MRCTAGVGAVRQDGRVLETLSDLLWREWFAIFGAPVTTAEIIGFVFGAWCVWLAGRQNPWNWPVGLVQVTAYLVLFWGAGLYADSALQVVYIVLGLWGWANWLRGDQGSELSVTRTPQRQWAVLAVAGVIGTAIVWLTLTRHTDSTVPLADSSTTVLSLLATYAMGRKWLESWWIWIAADIIYVPLYASKGLWLTAVLYSVFLALCVIGLSRWTADLRARELVAV